MEPDACSDSDREITIFTVQLDDSRVKSEEVLLLGIEVEDVLKHVFDLRRNGCSPGEDTDVLWIVDELLEVNGIGSATLEKIRSQLSLQ